MVLVIGENIQVRRFPTPVISRRFFTSAALIAIFLSSS